MSLMMEDGQTVGTAEFWPEISSTPRVWEDRVIANRQSFFISPDQLPGTLSVQIEITDGRDGASLPVAGEQDDVHVTTVLDLLALGAVAEISEADLPEPGRSEVFAETIQLASASVPTSVPAGAVLPVGLFWRVLAPIAADYTVFIHVLDGSGETVAQLDRPPGGGTSPTSGWQPGQILHDTYPIPLPDQLTGGQYRLRMGLYTWPDLTRQPIRLNGEPLGDHLIVAEFAVVDSPGSPGADRQP
jgi:hypothetical protein